VNFKPILTLQNQLVSEFGTHLYIIIWQYL